MTQFDEFLREIFALRTQKKDTIGPIRASLKKLGNPHLAYPTIHVAGTNGKGQVCTKIAAALTKSGYTTSLFTSPHLFDYEERIQIDGRMISKDKVLQLYEQIKRLDAPRNFFQITTLIAFCYFAEENVDVAVIEAGLGGLYDSTNVVTPLLSVITSIGFDHTDMLGETIEEIAFQKAGVIKPKTPVVLGPSSQQPLLLSRAEKLSAPAYLVEEKPQFPWEENRAIAKKALGVLSTHFTLSKEAITQGIDTSPRCRFEKRGDVIYDVAHNVPGFARLKSALSHLYPNYTFRFVVGIAKGKDLKGCLKEIETIASHIHYIETSPFAECGYQFSCSVSKEQSIEKGMEAALKTRSNTEIVVVSGSFLLMKRAIDQASKV